MNATEISFDSLSSAFGPLCQQLEDWKYVCFLPTKALDRGWWIGIRTNHETIPRGSTYLDINILGDVFYLLHIEVQREDRGKGYGNRLYEMLTDIAKNLGCRRIEQTPSGRTWRGETRASYLERRGWVLENDVAYKDLNSGC